MFPRGNTIIYLVTCITCNYLVVLAYITRTNYKYFMGSMGSTIFYSLLNCILLKKVIFYSLYLIEKKVMDLKSHQDYLLTLYM